jgi:hypothetical protein
MTFTVWRRHNTDVCPEVGVHANVRIKNSSESYGSRTGVSINPRGLADRVTGVR